MYRVENMIFDGWRSVPVSGGYTDTFEIYVDALGALPPYDYAAALEAIGRRLSSFRPRSSLWIRVINNKGKWYISSLKRGMRTPSISYAITPIEDREFDPLKFSIWPVADKLPAPLPPTFEKNAPYWKWERLYRFCIQCMARLEVAYTREVASAMLVSSKTAFQALSYLASQGYVEKVERKDDEGYNYWKITRKGLTAALRLWRIPAGQHFDNRAERQNPPATHESGRSTKHNRVKRLFGTLLSFSVMGRKAEIYASWSEVALPVGALCDALAWGTYDGEETLFWLEVLSNHMSLDLLTRNIQKKANNASQYAMISGIPIIFIVTGAPWTIKAIGGGLFTNVPNYMAVVAVPWDKVDALPEAIFGQFSFLI